MDTDKISEIILDKENYKIIYQIVNDYLVKANTKFANMFFSETEKLIQDKLCKLCEAWVVKTGMNIEKQYSKPIKIYKKSWVRNDEEELCFCMEFQKSNFMEALVGFKYKNNNADILKQHIREYNPENTNSNWATYKLLKEDFAKAIILDDYSAEKFANEMVQMVIKFEVMADEINHLKQQKII
jgi:hypothetical protein